MSKDRYGLISVDVVLDDRITNFEIIADGYAWHDQEYEKSTLMPKRLRNRKSLACGLIRILDHQGSFDFNRGCQSDWIRLATQSTTADAFAMVIDRSITLLLILGLFCGCCPSLRDAAEQGDAKAQYTLGNTYQDGDGVEKDFVEAMKWFRKAAEQGFAGAQNNLGNAYQLGTGVPKDSVEAVKWFRKAAEQGFAKSQFSLGVAYDNGDGVDERPAEAVWWFRKAAEQGFAKAQKSLGNAYYTGDGVKKNSAESVHWYRLAAEQRHADAQFSLGVAYYIGDGVPKDSVEAVKWFRKAAEQGYADAQCYLGDAYELGAGVPKDALEAYAWYNSSAVTDEYAKAACSRLEKTLSPQDIARAQSRSTELLKMIKQ